MRDIFDPPLPPEYANVFEADAEELVNTIDEFLASLDLPDSFVTQVVNFVNEHLAQALADACDPDGEAADYYHEMRGES